MTQSQVVLMFNQKQNFVMRITTSKIKNAKQLNYSKQQTPFLKIKKSIKSDLYYLFKQKKEANKY